MSKPLSLFASAIVEWQQTSRPGVAVGSQAPLSSVWSTAGPPTVLCFLRRLGCKLCRVMAQDMEKLQREHPDKLRLACFSFERLGEGSDADGSFTKGAYFSGDLLQVGQQEVYAPLFGRKGLVSGFGLASLITDKSGKIAEAKARGIPGNFTGDGMQLGGLIVVDSSGKVLLDHRQKFFGDDPSPQDILDAIAEAGAPASGSAAGGGGGGQ